MLTICCLRWYLHQSRFLKKLPSSGLHVSHLEFRRQTGWAQNFRAIIDVVGNEIVLKSADVKIIAEIMWLNAVGIRLNNSTFSWEIRRLKNFQNSGKCCFTHLPVLVAVAKICSGNIRCVDALQILSGVFDVLRPVENEKSRTCAVASYLKRWLNKNQKCFKVLTIDLRDFPFSEFHPSRNHQSSP